MKTKIITVFKYDDSSPSRHHPPENAVKFREWLNEKLALIPAEYLDTAEIDIGAETSYDCATATIAIEYRRPMTSDEIMAESEAIAKAVALTENREREQFEALKRKFEPANQCERN